MVIDEIPRAPPCWGYVPGYPLSFRGVEDLPELPLLAQLRPTHRLDLLYEVLQARPDVLRVLEPMHLRVRWPCLSEDSARRLLSVASTSRSRRRPRDHSDQLTRSRRA
jgi:hypothetical protein